MATRNGLEPSTSSVTGWRSNQLSYRAIYLFVFIPFIELCGLISQRFLHALRLVEMTYGFWWAFTDSNRGPIGYEPTALTN